MPLGLRSKTHATPAIQGALNRIGRASHISESGWNAGALGRADTPAGARQRRADELAEERRRPRRPRLELRVELAGDEPRVVLELDDLDQAAFLICPRHDQPGFFWARAEVVVHLVAMPVTLVDHVLAVGLPSPSGLDELDRLRAQAHRAAQVLD